VKRPAGRSTAASPGLDRPRLLFWLLLLAALNAFAGTALRIVPEHGLSYALFELFGISAIVWTALAASLALLRDAQPEPLRRADGAAAAAVIMVALLPVSTASAVSLAALGGWMIATAPGGTPIRRAGLIALAMTGPLLWGRVLLALFSGPLLAADTWLVGELTGAAQAGNILALSDGSGRIGIAPGCSSWQGMSLALLLWMTVNQWFGVPFGRRAVAVCLAALAATIAINVLRLGAMVRFPAHIQEIHHGWGWHLSMWTTLVAVAAICLWGARREAFR
jgi:exosortase/archaeosortase family protein